MHAMLPGKLESMPSREQSSGDSILALEAPQGLWFLFVLLHVKTVQEPSASFLLQSEQKN